MFPKTALVILVTLLSAACLLGMRQRRLMLAHDITQTLRDMDHTRQSLWNLQGKIASYTHPNDVNQQVENTGLHVEPLHTPAPSPAGQTANANDSGTGAGASIKFPPTLARSDHD